MSEKRVFVVGVGMTRFLKPSSNNPDYPDLGKQAAQRALRDAGITYSSIEAAVVGYIYGDSTCGQRILYEVGLTGIPIYNINNNGGTGATTIYLCSKLIQAGADCTLALGFEKMEIGSLKLAFPNLTYPAAKHIEAMEKIVPLTNAPIACQVFGNAGIEHQEKYGTKDIHFAKIGHKNHKHSVNNPYAQFRTEYNLEEIMNSPKIYGPLTKLQCSPTTDGAAAVIVCSENFIKKHKLEDQAVEILAIALTTDTKSSFDGKSRMSIAGYDMTKEAATQVFRKSGKSPKEVNVCELHDCFSANELIAYEALGLCEEGKAAEFIDNGDNTYGGRCVVNPSGGLISRGHPIGATGVAQCTEICWQLRGMAELRQVEGAKLGLQHTIGLGGSCVVALYKKYNGNKGISRQDQTSDPSKLEQFEEGVFQPLKNAPLITNKTSSDFITIPTDPIFGITKEYINQHGPSLCEQVREILCFEIIKFVGDKNPKTFTIDLKNSPGAIYKGKDLESGAVIRILDKDIVNLTEGRFDLETALTNSQINIRGNLD